MREAVRLGSYRNLGVETLSSRGFGRNSFFRDHVIALPDTVRVCPSAFHHRRQGILTQRRAAVPHDLV